MTPAEKRMDKLNFLGWQVDETAGRHQICGERCRWIFGNISGVEWSGWISDVSGMVYLHANPAIDLAFDAFCGIVVNGWPEKKVARAGRSLFGEDD